VVVFLASYRKNYSYISDSRFLNAFSYALYDFLEDKKAQECNINFKNRLEKVAQETFHLNKSENSHLTKELLEECLQGKHKNFSKELSHYLISFLPMVAEQDLNIHNHEY
jgi:hypothetical protein